MGRYRKTMRLFASEEKQGNLKRMKKRGKKEEKKGGIRMN